MDSISLSSYDYSDMLVSEEGEEDTEEEFSSVSGCVSNNAVTVPPRTTATAKVARMLRVVFFIDYRCLLLKKITRPTRRIITGIAIVNTPRPRKLITAVVAVMSCTPVCTLGV